MKITQLLDKTAAIIRRDLLTAIRYRTGFLITAAGAAAELAAFYYLSRAIGSGFRPDGVDYFPFLLVGTGFYTFLVMGINAFLVIVQGAQQTGTLEILMTTSTPAPVLVFLSAISAFAGNTVQLLFYLGAGLLLFGAPLHANLLGCVVIFALSLTIAVAIGILAAALQLAIQKGSALVWLLGSGAWFMTGTLFPVATLPGPLRAIAQLIPITHSLDGMRMALLQAASWGALAGEIGFLALFSLTLLPFSLVVFSYTLRRARLQGTLSFY
ncbi:MAG TPA: ABC transporter permease [Terriglobales bacterium]|jgi:ABC-2 type transport system permease protein|nr:ABC transporter permease [Terriglobales bacterium]